MWQFVKKTSRSIYSSVLLIILTESPLFAQLVPEKIPTLIADYTSQAIHEKLFVHTDKDYYLTGELLWFKVYAVDASYHKPLSLSKVCYLEILDSANTPMVQTKIALDHAMGNGSLYLPQSLQAGNYKLRAYTRWMQNFDAEWFFEKMITIVNLQKLPEIAPADNEPQLQIHFFAEGGNFVNGLENKVAFKALERNGHPVDFTGILLDNADTLLSFKPTHHGMGYFTLTPQQGHHYNAQIIPTKGKAFNVALPKAIDSGTVLHLTQSGETYTAEANTNLIGEKAFYLLAHTRNITQFAAKMVVKNGKGSFSFKQSQLGDGINVITLFNHMGEPLCERLVFKHPEKNIGLSLSTPKFAYKKRDSVSITIASTQLPANDSANLSLSVFRTDSLQSISPIDIQSYLLLSSDLKGTIENPSYYFRDRNLQTDEALDLLLLTQGWRRFEWQNVLAKKQQQITLAPELQGHIITGTVLDAATNIPANNITAYLSAPSPITLFKTALSDSNGNIKADLLNFFGSNKLVAQTQEEKYRVKINNPFSKAYAEKKVPVLYRPITFPNTLLEQSMSMQVQNIYSCAELNQFELPTIADTMPFYQQSDVAYKLDDYTRFTTIEEILREYVTLVDVRIKDQDIQLHVIDPLKKVYFEGSPLNLLDGVPIFNTTQFFEFDPKKIVSLDLISQQYVLGNATINGVLNWKTYQPTINNYSFEKNVTVADYESLQMARVFYSPAYNQPATYVSHLPDYRNVLHWKPDITLKQLQPTTTHFFTSDLPGKYVIVVQGISANGRIGIRFSSFEVK